MSILLPVLVHTLHGFQGLNLLCTSFETFTPMWPSVNENKKVAKIQILKFHNSLLFWAETPSRNIHEFWGENMLCTLMSCEMLPLILSYVNESKKKLLKTTQNFETNKN